MGNGAGKNTKTSLPIASPALWLQLILAEKSRPQNPSFCPFLDVGIFRRARQSVMDHFFMADMLADCFAPTRYPFFKIRHQRPFPID